MIPTAVRVLRQLRHDPRTVALMLFVPGLLMVLLRYVFDDARTFSRVAPALLGVFPFLLMFLVTSITTLRERTSGTLERLMTTPLAKISLLAGYGLGFALTATVQALITAGVSFGLGLSIDGSLAWLLVVTLIDALLGVAIGLLGSAFARTEFQAIQLMPVVVLPQFLLCGVFQPRSEMAEVLRWASDVLPLPYAVEALQHIASSTSLTAGFLRDVLVLVGFVLAGLVAAAATLRRQTA